MGIVKLEPPRLPVNLLSDVVGFIEVFQHMPLSVTGDPKSDRISPPHVADVVLISEMSFVVIFGTSKVVKVKPVV